MLVLFMFVLDDAPRVLFHLSTLYSSIQKKKTKKKENVAAWERATGKSAALLGASVFKTMMDMQV